MSLIDNTFFDCVLKGVSSVFDLSPEIELPERLKPKSASNYGQWEMDVSALKKDWEKVGQDLKKALNDYEKFS